MMKIRKESKMWKVRKGSVLSIVLVLLFHVSVFAQPSILVDASTGRITVKASRQQVQEIDIMLIEMEGSSSDLQIRQVEIEAKILSVSEDAVEQYGLNLERLTGVQVPTGTEGEETALEYGPKTLEEIEKGKGPLMFSFYRLITGEEKFEAILNMLIREGKAEVLSAPRVTTKSGEVAVIGEVRDISYVADTTYDTETGERKDTYEYATVGVVLQVLPEIVGDNLVQMAIVPIVSEADTTKDPRHPEFKRQIAPTNVTVREGEPVIIGGLIRKKKTEIETRFPILSYLPVIGNLFRNQEEKEERSNLLITVKPRIITDREIKGRTKRILTFTYALAEDMARQIVEMVSPQGVIEINPKEAPPNSILVRDDEDRVKVIQEVLNGIGSFVEQRRQRIFSLQFSSAQPTKEILKSLLSKDGSIKIEEENSLLVEDGAYQLSQIEKAVLSLEESNKIPQTKTFSLKYVQAGEMVSSLDEVLSPQGFIKIEDNNLIVKDNNWVIEQIRKKIEELDISGNSS